MYSDQLLAYLDNPEAFKATFISQHRVERSESLRRREYILCHYPLLLTSLIRRVPNRTLYSMRWKVKGPAQPV